jgi:amidase
MTWQDIAAQKRKTLASLIPLEWRITGIPSPTELRHAVEFPERFLAAGEVAITRATASELVAKLATGELTSKAVTRAFCHRAAVAHQIVNCLVEIFFDEALAQAEALDDHFAATGKTVGPMHGLPISLKDQFRVKGVETSMGYVGWLGTLDTYDSDMTTCLRLSGAVLYCKTNVPQALLVGETFNNVFGYTWNPHNRLLSSGGSSGGEGALIAARGSPLGVGTDIGGDHIRVAFMSQSCLIPHF